MTEQCMGFLLVLTYQAEESVTGVVKKTKCRACKDLLSCQEAEKYLPENNNYIKGIS